MRLIVGGAFQGKLRYAQGLVCCTPEQVAEPPASGEFRPPAGENLKILNHLEGWIDASLQSGVEPEGWLWPLLEANPDCIVLCQEIGCGIVPMEATERRWRETVGRIGGELARRAQTVERVACGLPLRLKGE